MPTSLLRIALPLIALPLALSAGAVPAGQEAALRQLESEGRIDLERAQARARAGAAETTEALGLYGPQATQQVQQRLLQREQRQRLGPDTSAAGLGRLGAEQDAQLRRFQGVGSQPAFPVRR
jgi:hypothetical protein